jgi:DcuC family C4-dicarboxylate transporter
MTTALALLVIAGSVWLTARRVDVRLALGLGAVPLFALAGRLPDLVGFMARELANPATVVPIGSAMGFSYVLRLTGCDRHLIHLLLRPLRYVRPLLVPGGILAGYLVNTTLVSQTSAAAVVGPILIPLLIAGGIPAHTAGAVLLLGCSMGGELFNPGAVEIVTLAGLTGAKTTAVVRAVTPANLLASGTALAVFWALAARRQGRGPVDPGPDAPGPDPKPAPDGFRVNYLRAAVPLIPIALLFTFPQLVRLDATAFPKLGEPATILAAMLIGMVAAAAAAPGAIRGIAGAFFDGAGYAYVHVISLIVMATVFTEGVRASGLVTTLTDALAGQRPLAIVAAIALPFGLARVCGSGIAPAVAVMKALVPVASALSLDPTRLGAMTAVAAHFGRTMSPAAAVVAMCSTLAGADRAAVLRDVTPPLLAGLLALLLASWAGVV